MQGSYLTWQGGYWNAVRKDNMIKHADSVRVKILIKIKKKDQPTPLLGSDMSENIIIQVNLTVTPGQDTNQAY